MVIYNGADFTTEHRQTTKGSDTVITIARMVEQKDHETLIKAFKLVNQKLPKVKLLIPSSGPLEPKLKKLTRKLNLTKSIKFLGWVKEITPYIKKADIFVLSSKREGFGYVIIEAMAYGKPIISTDTPYGPAEILDNGKYGILTPLGDEKALSKAIITLLTNDKKYQLYSQKALLRSKYFSLDKMLSSYKKLILETIDK